MNARGTAVLAALILLWLASGNGGWLLLAIAFCLWALLYHLDAWLTRKTGVKL